MYYLHSGCKLSHRYIKNRIREHIDFFRIHIGFCFYHYFQDFAVLYLFAKLGNTTKHKAIPLHRLWGRTCGGKTKKRFCVHGLIKKHSELQSLHFSCVVDKLFWKYNVPKTII